MPVGEAWIFSGNITRLRNEINKYFEEQWKWFRLTEQNLQQCSTTVRKI
jgi:hypothetical protein